MKSMLTGRMRSKNKTLSSRKPFLLFVASLLCTAMMLPSIASAAYYNTYTTVAPIDNVGDITSAQGFDVGSVYAYSIKVNKNDTKAVIYRTNMSTGATTLMKNGDGTNYTTQLGHANDIVLSTIDGTHYMFVVTTKVGSMSLVKLKYVGDTYTKVGNYTIKLNGQDKLMTGVKITSKDTNNIHFLFKTGMKPEPGQIYFRGTLPLNANSGIIHVTEAFRLNIAGAKVNGNTIANIDLYANQGFGYHNNSIYVPLTFENISIVLVYRHISTASGTINADDNLSFRITSEAFPLFEIESVGIAHGNKLWFNTNRRTDPNTGHDGVHYFNGFSASQM
ncbi:hypothetical protein [Paenibacillus sp. 481]|uniref:hypothetical protein n=1 Tax=Paenibacillus sp. 481 TaxID=2835869 RepID=UPI001E546588|nr:hypothetical protein [Paenibacillus sp. 481]UHA73385.1 hypothetical protein KIK04_22935 [Paenibacillus sp. 481]